MNAIADNKYPTWIIVTRQGMEPTRKGPFYSDQMLCDTLLALYALYPTCSCIVIDMPYSASMESGEEWLASRNMKPHDRSRTGKNQSDDNFTVDVEARFHRSIREFLTKQEQGRVMGLFRYAMRLVRSPRIPLHKWITVREDRLCISRCCWIYPDSTDDEAGERDERRYAAVEGMDGEIVLHFPPGSDIDAKHVHTMLTYTGDTAVDDPLEWKLPCDVPYEGGIMRTGSKLRTLISAFNDSVRKGKTK